jgi:hypothetical protein
MNNLRREEKKQQMHGRRKSTSSDRESRRVAALVYSGLLTLAFALFAALWLGVSLRRGATKLKPCPYNH